MKKLAILLLCFSATLSSFADGEAHVRAYNTLVKMLADRAGLAGVDITGIEELDLNAPVTLTQTDLNAVRTKVVELLENHYVVSAEDIDLTGDTVDKAFPLALRFDDMDDLVLPSLMKDLGENGLFTMVPPDYSSTGGSYSNDFESVPLLWIHFQELHTVMSRMTSILRDGQWIYDSGAGHSLQNQSWDRFPLGCFIEFNPPRFGDNAHTWLSAFAAMQTTPLAYFESYTNNLPRAVIKGFKKTDQLCGGNVQVYTEIEMQRNEMFLQITNLPPVDVNVTFYNRAHLGPTNLFTLPRYRFDSHGASVTRNGWTAWDEKSLSGGGTLNSEVLAPPGFMNAPEEPVEIGTLLYWAGYFVSDGIGIVEAAELFSEPIEEPGIEDSDQDGLVFQDCQACSGDSCAFVPDIDWKSEAYGNASTRFPLGRSVGEEDNGLQVNAYVEEYSVGNFPFQMFSLDTQVLSFDEDPGLGYAFATIQRPGGHEVVFALSGPKAGEPVGLPNKRYRARRVGAEVEIVFPDSNYVVHRFPTNGVVNQVYMEHRPSVFAVDPWAGLQISRLGDQITEVISPQGTATPVYGGDRIVSVDYTDPDGNPIREVDILPGSQRYQTKDEAGNLLKEVRVSSTNGMTTIDYGDIDGTNMVATIREQRITQYDAATQQSTVFFHRIRDPDSASPSTNTQATIRQTFAWGDEVIAEISGYGTSDALTNTFLYYTNALTDGGGYAHARAEQRFDGSWISWTYDTLGRVKKEIRPFENSDFGAPEDECRVSTFLYVGDSELATLNFPTNDVGATNDERSRCVIETALGMEISRSYTSYFADYTEQQRCRYAGADYGNLSNLVSRTYVHTNGIHGGKTQRIEHSDGQFSLYSYVYDAGTMELTTTLENGAGSVTAITNGTRTITVRTTRGDVLSEETLDIESGLTLSHMTYGYDGLGRRTSSTDMLRGLSASNIYGCCTLDQQIDLEGIIIDFTYDALDRQETRTRNGVTTHVVYDAEGNIIRQTQQATGESDIVLQNHYDASGRLRIETNALGGVTTYAYAYGPGETMTTVYPDGGQIVRVNYRDGRPASQNGDASIAEAFKYGVEQNGETTRIYRGPDTNTTEWVQTRNNMLGNLVEQRYPDGYIQTTIYDDAARPVMNSDGLSTNLTDYDNRSRVFRSGLDLNGNEILDKSSNDRITEQTYDVVLFDGKPANRTRTWVWTEAGRELLSTDLVATDQSTVWNIGLGGTNKSVTVWDSATQSRTVTQVQPDQTQTIQSYSNGLLRLTRRLDAIGTEITRTTLTYDGHERLETSTSPAITAGSLLRTLTYDPAGNLLTETTSNGVLSQTWVHQYDTQGRRKQTTTPDSLNQMTFYNKRGQIIGSLGARTLPQRQTYDDQGRLLTLTTFRDYPSAFDTNSLFIVDGDNTMWNYDSQRGWLESKTYADGKGMTYTYYRDGLLSSRTGGRGIVTSNTYDNARNLQTTSYSDSTPPVTYSYNRLNQVTNIVDAAGTHNQIFTLDGLLLSATAIGTQSNLVVYGYDTLNRRTNLVYNSYVVDMTYDSAGRVNTLQQGSREATYQYGRNGTTWTNLDLQTGGTPLTQTREYDELNRLDQQGTTGAAKSFSYEYTYNQANQRTRSDWADGRYWDYTYDDYGQLIRGTFHHSDGSPNPALSFDYSFDSIGNRLTFGQASQETTYTPNQLNQLTQRTSPNSIVHYGHADATAKVTLQGEAAGAVTAQRNGADYWNSVAVTRAETHQESHTIRVLKSQTPSNTLVRTVTQQVVVAQSPEVYTYDDDGNLTQDAQWGYTWDAENRLIQMETRNDLNANVPRQRVEYTYDHQSRRRAKRVSDWNGSSYDLTSVTTFVYDGWLLLQEQSDSGGTMTTNDYIWGLDVSETQQGAGGVDGLLWQTTTQSQTAVYNGNGNIMAWVNDDGSIAAEVVYTPFGKQAITAEQTESPFGFSTKYQDHETDLLYYGFRYHNPETGRWLSRDPIGEDGGQNLYGFVLNNAVGEIDPFGNKILSMKIVYNGSAMLSDEVYTKRVEERTYHGKTIVGNLGFRHRIIPASTEFTRFSLDLGGTQMRPFVRPSRTSVGFKFEYVVNACLGTSSFDRYKGSSDSAGQFKITQTIIGGGHWKRKKGKMGTWKAIVADRDRGFPTTLPHPDGPSTFDFFPENLPALTVVAGDMPRDLLDIGDKFEYWLKVRFRVKAKDRENAFEGVHEVVLFYDFDGGRGTARIITEPTEVR